MWCISFILSVIRIAHTNTQPLALNNKIHKSSKKKNAKNNEEMRGNRVLKGIKIELIFTRIDRKRSKIKKYCFIHLIFTFIERVKRHTLCSDLFFLCISVSQLKSLVMFFYIVKFAFVQRYTNKKKMEKIIIFWTFLLCHVSNMLNHAFLF